MPTPSRAENTRARLLDAAVAAFSEKGFHGTTTRDIAGGAGMSPAAVYVHHKSKEELLFVISRQGHQQALAVIREARAATPDLVEQIGRVGGAFAEYHAVNHTVARILNYELTALTGEHRAVIDELRSAIDRDLRALVSDGAEAGVFTTPDPALAATSLASMCIDIARWYREDGEWTPEQIGAHYADLALRLVGAAPPSTETAGTVALERWLLSGGHWELVTQRAGLATVALMTCDGGQEMDRVVVPVDQLPQT